MPGPVFGDDPDTLRRQLLQRMLAERGIAPAAQESRPVAVAQTEEAPLSPAQERVWFHRSLHPDDAVHNLTCAVHLAGVLDIEALTTALAQVVAEQSILRTVYDDRGGRPVQRIRENLAVPIQQVHLSADGTDRLASARAWAKDAARIPFDLHSEPPIRVSVVHLGPAESVLIAVIHHIAADDGTWAVLFPPLFRHYDSRVNGAELPDPHPHHYADFAVWQRSRLTDERVHTDLGYWRSVLAPPPAPLPLPVDRSRGEQTGDDGADTSVLVDRSATERLVQFGRTHGATPFMTVLAVFVAALHRITGSTDLTVGTPAVLRDDETASMAGNFQNTLALRFTITDRMTFASLVNHVREVAVAAYAHQETPFDQVVADLRPPRSVGRTPLFDVMFLDHAGVFDAVSPSGLVATEIPIHNGTSQFDLTVALSRRSEQTELVALYRRALFEPDTVRGLLDVVARVAQIVSTEPDSPIATLPLADDEQVNSAWERAAKHSTYPESTLPAGFARAVAEHRDRIAVTHGDEAVTYGRLDLWSAALARIFVHGGVHPGDRVLVALPPGPALVAALVAVTRTGAAYVPVDPAYPRERIAQIVRDSAASLLVCGPEATDELPDGVPYIDVTSIDVTSIDVTRVDASGRNGHDGQALDVTVAPSDAAYVLYTSGSTGTPKGVVVSHSNVTRLFDSTDEILPSDETDVWTMIHSSAFDFSVWEMWGALLHGGRLVIADRDTTRTPEALLELVCREQVTILSTTPSAFFPFAAVATADKCPLPLRRIVFGGEALFPSRLSTWFGRYGDTSPELVNMYGITETTVHVTHRRLTVDDATDEPGSPLGDPLSDLALVVADPVGRPVPDGVVGELWVGGSGVATGYFADPVRTAERFVQGHGAARDVRFYRSGDLVLRRTDGTLEYRGRADTQLEVRGHRVEPAEVEAVLAAHTDVDLAAVTVDGDRLEAHVVRLEGTDPDVPGLRLHCARFLPAHMVPSVFNRHDDLPLTSNGKLDRARIGSTRGRRLSAATTVRITDGSQRDVATIWHEVLGTDAIGPDDNFFDLGGHSLLLAQVRTRLSERLGRDVPITDLYAHPTIRTIADHLARGGVADTPADHHPHTERRKALLRTRAGRARGRTTP
ncbi:non-ribosomal peptide synthetase [Rhodococcus artemisiae]|uniref:Amino acid adenylation domain-containing protein n=1 Tax=Rhodococcus artemisiae TaxID=714159 RepID=A0ABU7LFT7_9NOCA|nr:amino acid adenylation domain-containing protein [Rhodococcus artemisiae]MEE2060149.1 amino acid adenylation domain-containing protein [Rhodococcus artemisiae]